MEAITITEPTYFVIYGDDDEVIYLEGEPGQVIATGRPTVESFTDEVLAKSRAEELGYVFPEIEVLP